MSPSPSELPPWQIVSRLLVCVLGTGTFALLWWGLLCTIVSWLADCSP